MSPWNRRSEEEAAFRTDAVSGFLTERGAEKRGAHIERDGPQHPATTKKKWGFMAHAAGACVPFAKATGSGFDVIKLNIHKHKPEEHEVSKCI